MAASPVLDSFALLSFLRDEPGGEKVAALLEKAGQREQPAQMTEVNYAEIQYIIRRKDGDATWRVVANELPALPIEFHPHFVCGWRIWRPISRPGSNSAWPTLLPRLSQKSKTRNW